MKERGEEGEMKIEITYEEEGGEWKEEKRKKWEWEREKKNIKG